MVVAQSAHQTVFLHCAPVHVGFDEVCVFRERFHELWEGDVGVGAVAGSRVGGVLSRDVCDPGRHVFAVSRTSLVRESSDELLAIRTVHTHHRVPHHDHLREAVQHLERNVTLVVVERVDSEVAQCVGRVQRLLRNVRLQARVLVTLRAPDEDVLEVRTSGFGGQADDQPVLLGDEELFGEKCDVTVFSEAHFVARIVEQLSPLSWMAFENRWKSSHG